MTPEASAIAVEYADEAARVARWVARYCRRPWLADELESASGVWLTDAAIAYDPLKGKDARAFALFKVRCRAIDYVRADSRRPAQVSMDEAGRDRKNTNDAGRGGWVEAPEPEPEYDPLDFDRLVRHLRGRGRAMIEAVYLRGLTIPEAGAELGLSTTRSYFVHREAIARLRDDLRRAWPPHRGR